MKWLLWLVEPFKKDYQIKESLKNLFRISLLCFIVYIFYVLRYRGTKDLLIAYGMSLGVVLGVWFLLTHAFDQLKDIPSSTVFYLGVSITCFAVMFTSSKADIGNYIAIASVVVLLFALSFEMMRWKNRIKTGQLFMNKWYFNIPFYIIFGLSIGLNYYIMISGGLPADPINSAFDTFVVTNEIKEQDVIYEVNKGVYGSQAYIDTYNLEGIVSETTRLSYFLNSWNDSREEYLGYNSYDVPLNAHYYEPVGQGPFPVVLIVHGNHEMTHLSHLGYDYLGTYLAQRGYFVASVDENFLNYSTFDSEFLQKSLGNENDARAYVLLQHLAFLEKTDSFSYLDFDNIALMGHSRGGEAVAIAKYFNDIKHLPNDSRKLLNMDYNIKTIVAIAPTDGQYKPANRKIDLKNVNYLLLHGSHDMDVSYMTGLNQYERIDNDPGFVKSSVLIYGANHGQFNEDWLAGDQMPLAGRLHNTGQLIDRAVQEHVAEQVIYYFLEGTLKDNETYKENFDHLQNFVDLPGGTYMTQYHTGQDRIIADFTEDAFLQTGTLEGTIISATSVSKWSEGTMKMDNKTNQVYGAYISWAGNYNSNINFDLRDADLSVSNEDSVFFTIGADDDSKALIDFNIVIEDTSGHTAVVSLSEYGLLQHRIDVELTKFQMIEDIKNRETFLQSYVFPINSFEGIHAVDLTNISDIRLEFLQDTSQTIFLKEIGIR